MNGSEPINTTLDLLRKSLRLPRWRRRAITREIQAHLEDVRHELRAGGLSAEAAELESVMRLGDPTELASAFSVVHKPRRLQALGLACGLAGTLIAGAYGAGSTMASSNATRHHHAIVAPPRPAASNRCPHHKHVAR